jgi:aspartyl-tRNA(Asn)/glutamyl-tRNA(Gln) amidotransferase subunit C
MSISLAEVEHIAKLARLELSDQERRSFQKELGKIIEYFDHLKKLDTSKISPLTHTVPLENALREDEVRPCLSTDQALQNAPRKRDHYFQVPKVVG